LSLRPVFIGDHIGIGSAGPRGEAYVFGDPVIEWLAHAL
jgi:hypothetical protein